MKFIIEGEQIGEEDLITIAKFFREFWKDRKDRVYFFIEKGTEDLSKDECMDIFRQVFLTDDTTKSWKYGKITSEDIRKFKEALRKK